jgi:serine/threonine protein kinase/formylglycine-generating enzyme required for sulfatase activity
MKPERWKQIEKIYDAALKRAADRRASFLDQACEGDGELRSEVASLLASEEQAGDFLAAPALEVAAQDLAAAASSPIGRRIGHYQVLSLLGSGGMGEVYLARDTRLGRKIALKLLPAELTADADRLRRFEQEARAASALNHPNIITIFEIGQEGSTRYIATEFIDGQTLRHLMKSGRMDLLRALDAAAQVAAALAAAHRHGIVHRDIKPENVMLRRDGYVKVLDFGLAKLTEERQGNKETGRQGDLLPVSLSPLLPLSSTGAVMGTPRYMSPEQARGEKVDARADIFSLGSALYEMITGHPPFTGATASDVIAAILRDTPPPLTNYNPEAPRELEQVVSKALRKNRDERYQAASELLADLRRLKKRLEPEDEIKGDLAWPAQQESGGDATHIALTLKQAAGTGDVTPARVTAKRWSVSVRRRRSVAVCALAMIVAVAGWLYWRNTELNKARAALPRIEELAKAERYFEAYDLAIEAQAYLPNDPTLTRVMRTIADDLSVVTDPPGARAYLKRFAPDVAGHFPDRQLIGVTPINHLQIARGAYLISMEKEGYASLERSVTGLLLRIAGMESPSPPISIDAKLIETSKAPPRMAFVPGGDYRLTNWSRPTDKSVGLAAYFIDKYEVTNREYKEFINAGGYLRREFWRRPIVRNRREIAWEEAIREFKDRTGLPGPRGWVNQDFPEGKAEHPVTDISWYEAAAYAAFRGKELPTVFQWEKAARGGLVGPGRGRPGYYWMPWGPFTGTIEQRANFNGRGTLPVESLEFGLSPYGCYHMAGNVSEWCRNESPEGFTVAGGSWEDPPYLFGDYGPYPGSYSSGKLGFRCALNAPGATGDQGAMPLFAKTEVPDYTPASDARFRAWQELYRYAQSPLDAQVVEVTEGADWRREKITYAGAEGERAIAYLYLPKHYPPPWQVIQYMPGDDVYQGFRSIPVKVDGTLAPFIKSGRAVLAVVLKGFPEREWPPNYTPPQVETIEYRDLILNWTADERRGLDYVEKRPDLDAGRVAYLGVSVDDSRKLLLPAVETRYRSVALIAAGLTRDSTQVLPEINPINLVPQIRAPKLILHGRYDENTPLKSQSEPLQKLLRGPKRIILFDGGHMPPPEIFVPPINAWLDETLGPVRRE